MNQKESIILSPAPVLIIDDDDFTRELIEDLLRDLGITKILCAGNGAQALGLFKSLDILPALVICDINMPEMDGVEFLRHLAELNFSGGICMLSGVHSALLEPAQHLADAYRLNFVGILEKPVEHRHLAKLLGKLCERKKYPYSPKENIEISPEELREGMAQGHITLFFQPKVELQQQRVIGAECLARYQHPHYGLLGPAAFIPTAEKYQLIDELTLIILRQAARQLSVWQQSGHRLKLSVNISMLNLHRLDLPEIFEKIVVEAGIQPQDIILEVTESGFPEQLAVCLEILVRLRIKGFLLSLDDFGTGYSTIQNLGRFPFSEIKLDRGFVADATHDDKAFSILESCIRLGKSLKLNLVAEGVENREELDLVTRLGCDEVQGYFFARPLPADILLTWKTEWEK
ncbi:hypothetical protein CCP3SC15_220026 [Gammaproteobacteria bacterium]